MSNQLLRRSRKWRTILPARGDPWLGFGQNGKAKYKERSSLLRPFLVIFKGLQAEASRKSKVSSSRCYRHQQEKHRAGERSSEDGSPCRPTSRQQSHHSVELS